MYWVGDSGEVGQFLHGYRSLWAQLLEKDRQERLAEPSLRVFAIGLSNQESGLSQFSKEAGSCHEGWVD